MAARRSKLELGVWRGIRFVLESRVSFHPPTQTLNIRYKESVLFRQTEEPLYDVLALLSDIGGALGLCLGSCLFTLLEIIDFLCFAYYHSTTVTSKS